MIFAALFFILYIRFIEPNLLITKNITVRTSKIDKPTKIVFFADTHFSEDYPIKKADEIIKKINNENVDIVLFGGDLVNGFKEGVVTEGQVSEKFSDINSNYGNYSVIGNHEIYGGNNKEKYNNIMSNGGFAFLLNDYKTIDDLKLNIIGLDDLIQGNPDPNVHKQITNDYFNVLLLHEPDFVDEMDLTNIDLALAGHTHGGQVYIPFLIDKFLPRGGRNYLKGLFENINGYDTDLFVTSGLGTTNLPIRFLNIPEIIILEIVPE